MKKIVHLAISDFKIIFRDSSLRSFLFIPILLFVLMIWVMPLLVSRYEVLSPYLSLFLVVAVVENTQLFSFISSMVLIDEKETGVAKVYGVVPIAKSTYILSRFLIPYFLTVMLNILMFAIQPLFEIPFITGMLISLLTALVVPVYALSINSIVKNRMQGLIYIKGFNMLVLLPITAFFIPESVKFLFGIFPTHWIFQSIDYATNQESPLYMLAIGFLFFVLLIWAVSRLFIKRHFV